MMGAYSVSSVLSMIFMSERCRHLFSSSGKIEIWMDEIERFMTDVEIP